ncbi:TraM recognition domain-containing protein [Nocardia sp. ET3-3]|uniref:TraM recognition domain-containing protein n=1 Tax=Nocardia terrae TaxID=2675851 RepID=A0A7K1UVT0_9NOCA|nr:type IV secretory system conjugative DNA transfer family protein [Nocardia terrae]MVU78496.1 TraM recognition domain-containing protein [Nocardia terrae]
MFEGGIVMVKVRRRQDAEITWFLRGLIWIAVAAGIVVVAVHLGNARSPQRQHVPADPITLLGELWSGQLRWPGAATGVVAGLATLIGVGLVVRAVTGARRARARHSIDAKAGFMGTGKALRPFTAAGVTEVARALDVPVHSLRSPGRPRTVAVPGIAIGTAVADGEPLFGSYADLHLDIWGPRQGKSACRVIPAILDAVGPVIVTASHRDVVDATRDVRAAEGNPVLVFDPQGIAGDEPPDWYWDPMAWVDRSLVRATQLAGHFADALTGIDDRDHLDLDAEELLAALFLAASVDCRSILQAWEWAANQIDTEPVEILRRYEHHRAASGLAALYNADPWRRDRVFAHATRMIRCLKFPEVHPWVTAGGNRIRFDELDLLERNGTLYSLSVAGRSSAAPLVSALTEAVLEVAIRKAAHSPRARLPIPLLAVFDDAANVVAWNDLPQRYSALGAHGIILMTVLQSWAQGVRCWGHGGMSELWSAATVKVIGGGVDDVPFLRERVEGIGTHEVHSRTVSLSTKGFGYSTAISAEHTLGVSELRSLPRGRAVLFAAGTPPVLIRTDPWWTGEHADAVERALAAVRGPQSRTTIDDLIGPSPLRPGVFGRDGGGDEQTGTIEEVRPL